LWFWWCSSKWIDTWNKFILKEWKKDLRWPKKHLSKIIFEEYLTICFSEERKSPSKTAKILFWLDCSNLFNNRGWFIYYGGSWCIYVDEIYIYLPQVRLLFKLKITLFRSFRNRSTFVFTILSFIVLLPAYSTASEDYVAWNKYTLANVFNGPTKGRLWITVIFNYLYTGYICYLFYLEYRNFSLKHSVHRTIQGDYDIPTQTNYSILIENIPPSLRSANALRTFLDKIFPGASVNALIFLKNSLIFNKKGSKLTNQSHF